MVPTEVFVFDKEKKTCGLLGGLVAAFEEFPLPLVLSGSPGGRGSTRFANLVLDVRELKKKSIEAWSIADQVATDGTPCCSIHVSFAEANELFISPEYVIFPDELRTAPKDGCLVRVRFDFTANEKGSKPADDAVLVVTRNGKEITRAKVTETQKHVLQMSGVKTADDVVEWRVEGADKKATHQGMFGFPMSGAAPGVVEYVVSVPEGELTQEGKTKQSREDG
jgi:hypothetical protein